MGIVFYEISRLISDVYQWDTSVNRYTLFEDLNANTSMEYLEFILSCESYFSIRISNDDAAGFKTVGDLCEYIERKLFVGSNDIWPPEPKYTGY